MRAVMPLAQISDVCKKQMTIARSLDLIVNITNNVHHCFFLSLQYSVIAFYEQKFITFICSQWKIITFVANVRREQKARSEVLPRQGYSDMRVSYDATRRCDFPCATKTPEPIVVIPAFCAHDFLCGL